VAITAQSLVVMIVKLQGIVLLLLEQEPELTIMVLLFGPTQLMPAMDLLDKINFVFGLMAELDLMLITAAG